MLVEVLKRSTYAEEGQMVYLNTFTKEQVCKATGKSLERMKQAIRIWVKNKILVRVARGVYQVNPYIFGKGEWRNIANLRATFDFSGGKVEVEREYIKTAEEKKPEPENVEEPKKAATAKTKPVSMSDHRDGLCFWYTFFNAEATAKRHY